MQRARHSKHIEELWSKAGILESVVSESERSDMRYRITSQRISFVREEFHSGEAPT